MKSQTTTTEEDNHVPVAEHREPWTLPGSIFKPRVKESDARAFYDGPAVSSTAPGRTVLLGHSQQHALQVYVLQLI
jgi:hypothetical protein